MKAFTEIKSEIENGRDKFTAEEMTSFHHDAAKAFIAGYDGDFEYMIEMRKQFIQKGQLTDGQVKGVLNVFRAEVLREKSKAESKLVQLADGVYQIGAFKFRIETQAADADFAAGETIISVPGKKKPWLGMGFVRGTKLNAWKRWAEDPDSQGLIVAAQLLVAGGKGQAASAAA